MFTPTSTLNRSKPSPWKQNAPDSGRANDHVPQAHGAKSVFSTIPVLMIFMSATLAATPHQTPQDFGIVPSNQCQLSHTNLSSRSEYGFNASSLGINQELTVEEESYPDALSAVIAASNYFNPLSIQEDREYIGAILKHKRQGHFIYTVSSGRSGEDSVSARIRVPTDYEITAFWHTHGNHHWTRKYFSDVDTQLAKHWGLPFYMAEATGALRVYHPEDPTLSSMRSRKMGLGAHRGYAKGRLVSQQQRRVKLATNMSQWFSMHQTPAANSPQQLGASNPNSCESVATQLHSKRVLNSHQPNQS